jgi:uncharacterized protein (TIGR02186 family)
MTGRARAGVHRLERRFRPAWGHALVAVLAAILTAVLSGGAATAQTQAPPPALTPTVQPKSKTAPPPAKAARPAAKKPQMPTQAQVESAPESSGETIQVDLSARTIPIETDFAGARLILFGAVENSKQTAPEAGLYDIVVVIEGPGDKIAVRRKARIAGLGLWINTRAITFQEVPSYYAIISTRPLEEIAAGKNLEKIQERHEIGFPHVYMEIAPGQGRNPAANELDAFKEALVRLKQREGLFREDQYGIAFIGRSLFRATIHLPANVQVGTFRVRAFLFRNGEFLSQVTAPLHLERAGLERVIHGLAIDHPLLYGIGAVLMAIGSGLLASIVFRKKAAH